MRNSGLQAGNATLGGMGTSNTAETLPLSPANLIFFSTLAIFLILANLPAIAKKLFDKNVLAGYLWKLHPFAFT